MIFSSSVYLVFLLVGIFSEADTIKEDVDAKSSSLNLPYPVVPLQIRATIDGVEVRKNGTLSNVISELATEYPHFDPSNHTSASSLPSSVQKRWLAGRFCIPVPGWGWSRTILNPVDAMINNMAVNPFNVEVDARTCAFIVNDPGNPPFQFVICNDNDHRVEPTANWVAWMGHQIVFYCNYLDPGNGVVYVGGQQFDDGGFNVIIASNWG